MGGQGEVLLFHGDVAGDGEPQQQGEGCEGVGGRDILKGDGK